MTAIDLRSDTVTKPTQAMLDAMVRAELGDDSRDGDPTVRKLEARAAALTGKEEGLFMPSGTMGNLVAALAHAQRGGEVLADQGAHLLYAEMGGVVAVGGLMFRGLPARRGAVDLDALAQAVSPSLTPKRLATALIWMETSHNDAGGTVLPLDHMRAVHALARANGVPVHTDGARLFNAAVALGVEAKAIAAHTDSVMFCLSKGLSAPIGSMLVGSAAFVTRARAFRRMVGGNLRQAGGLAAAGLVALDTMVERLAEDHRNAKRLAEGIAALDQAMVAPEGVETNIVRVDVSHTRADAPRWSEALGRHGVHAHAWNQAQLRLVTHRHVGAEHVEQALAAFAAVRGELGRS